MSSIIIHQDFKLNGQAFKTLDALYNFVKNDSKLYHFIKHCFSDDDFIEVKTSGSTGTPKTIKLSKKHIVNSAKITGKYFELPHKTKALLCLPIDYIAGKMMLIRAFVLGWELDIVEPKTKINISKNYDFSAMVPLQLRNSLTQIDKVKKIIVGGGVVAEDLLLKIQNSKCQLFSTYGMTETITHIAVKKLNNCSKFESKYYETLPNVKIYIDQRNCLLIKAPNITTALVKTNDIVQLISDRHFEWLGRYDNVINSGGVKLHPEKIEKKMSKFIFNRFFVTGVDDEVLGQKLILLIESKPYSISFDDKNLTRFEIPKEVYFLDCFVETTSKKIQRKKTLELILDNL